MLTFAEMFMTHLRSLSQINARWRLAAMGGAVFVFVTALFLVITRELLPLILQKIDLARTLFLWDPMPRVPKVVLLLLYVSLLGAGLLAIALLVRIFNASEHNAANVLARVQGLSSRLLRPRINVAVTIAAFACLPLFWALFVTPFDVPNEFLALQTQTRSADGKIRSSLDYLANRRLEGVVVPVPGASFRPPFRLVLAGPEVFNKAKMLALSFPELYWFDEHTETLEIQRIGDMSQYQALLLIADTRARGELQRHFRDEVGDAQALATRQYTAEEKDFLSRNRPELERALVLGRFFYHHNFIFSAAVVRAQDPQAEHGSQYGKGLTQGFAAVLSVVPENLRFNAYLLLLYASYPLYLVIVLLAGRACGLTHWKLYFIAVATVASFLLSEIETVRLGVGLAPWRHFLDVAVLYALWRYGQRSSAVNWTILSAFVFLGIYWSQEMGMFMGLSALGTLLALAIQQRELRRLGPFLGLMFVVVGGWLVSSPHAQALTSAVLLGANSPDIPFGLVTGTALSICGLLTAWLWLASRLGDRQALGWWCVAGAAVFYSAASGLYLMFYPRPHHLAPICPVLAFGIVAGWAILARAGLQEGVMGRMRLVVNSVTLALVLAVGGLAVLRMVEVAGERRIFATHVLQPWDFPAARLNSTGDPALLKQGVDMIRARNPQAVVDILSPWEVALLPLSGKGKNGPFVLSFDSLLTEREVNMLTNHLVQHGNDVLFVDSRLIAGQYELPLLEDAYLQNRVLSSVLRLRAHAMLREVFSRVRGCYRLEEQGPLISAWRRVSRDCLR